MFDARVGAVVVKLSVVCVADEVGVSVHVDSDGAPVQLKVTGVLNPVAPGTTVMVVLPGLPCFTEMDGTVEVSVKIWSVAVVVSMKAGVTVCVTPEPVALIVMPVVAGAMLAAVVMVIVVVLGLVPSMVTGVGLKATFFTWTVAAMGAVLPPSSPPIVMPGIGTPWGSPKKTSPPSTINSDPIIPIIM